MAAKFDLKRGGNEQYMFNLKAANGEVILTSELYNEKPGAVHGIESVKVHAVEDGRFERKRAKNGEPFFVLKAANGEVIGKSEMYSSSWAMERASGRSSAMLRPPAWMINRLSIFAASAGGVSADTGRAH